MALFDSKLTYGDFSRTGAQDCANAISIDEFDYKGGGTAEEIVERTWAQWERDGMEEQWLEQQDDFEGLDPHKAYEAWASGWRGRAVGYVERELERRRKDAEDELEAERAWEQQKSRDARRAAALASPHYVDDGTGSLVPEHANFDEALNDALTRVMRGNVSVATIVIGSEVDGFETLAEVMPLDSYPGRNAIGWLPATTETVVVVHEPGLIPHQYSPGHVLDIEYGPIRGGKLRDKSTVAFITAESEQQTNPPPKWWHRPSVSPRACYRTKADALKVFLDTNSDIVENYGGADYEVSPSEFDSINHKYDLAGKRAARSIADAVWYAMPVGRPYCLDRIDIEALNDTSPARESGVAFRLPDINYELQAQAEEAAHYAQQADEDVPDWVTEHEREPHRVFPPVPSMEGIVFMRPSTAEQFKRMKERSERMRKSNPSPGWVTKVVADHYDDLEGEVPAKWLPKVTSPSAQGARKITARLEEYGCGAYGCVLPTYDPKVVLKLTTDETEAQFAHSYAKKLSAPVVVKYRKTMELPERHQGHNTFLLWRDSADEVGRVIDAVVNRGGSAQKAFSAIKKQHSAAQKAYDALYEGKPATKLIEKWKVAAKGMGEAIPELHDLAEGMIKVVEKDKIFFGDIHDGNIGLVDDKWVIIDPGHVAVLTS